MNWHSVDVRVRLPEADAMGIVYHASFFTYLEAALQELFRKVQKDPQLSFRYPLGFPNVVVHVSCDFRSPAYFDNVLEIQVRIGKIGTKSLTVEFRVLEKQTQRLVAEGKRVHVAIDPETFKAVPISQEIREKLSWLTQA